MALFRSLLRAFTRQQYMTDEPIDCHAVLLNVMTLTNNYIGEIHDRANMFATIFFGILNPETGVLHYVNGGHEAPVIVRADISLEELRPTGPAVGMLPDLDFQVSETVLNRDDILITFTDGVTEARSEDGSFYTDERLMGVIGQKYESVRGAVSSIVRDVRRHIGDAPQADDITLLAIRRE